MYPRPFWNDIQQGWHQILPDWGLGFPTVELKKRIEGTFLCVKTQFSIKNSLSDMKFFPDRGGQTLPGEGATAPPPAPSGATPDFLSDILSDSRRRSVIYCCFLHSLDIRHFLRIEKLHQAMKRIWCQSYD